MMESHRPMDDNRLFILITIVNFYVVLAEYRNRLDNINEQHPGVYCPRV